MGRTAKNGLVHVRTVCVSGRSLRCFFACRFLLIALMASDIHVKVVVTWDLTQLASNTVPFDVQVAMENLHADGESPSPKRFSSRFQACTKTDEATDLVSRVCERMTDAHPSVATELYDLINRDYMAFKHAEAAGEELPPTFVSKNFYAALEDYLLERLSSRDDDGLDTAEPSLRDSLSSVSPPSAKVDAPFSSLPNINTDTVLRSPFAHLLGTTFARWSPAVPALPSASSGSSVPSDPSSFSASSSCSGPSGSSSTHASRLVSHSLGTGANENSHNHDASLSPVRSVAATPSSSFAPKADTGTLAPESKVREMKMATSTHTSAAADETKKTDATVDTKKIEGKESKESKDSKHRDTGEADKAGEERKYEASRDNKEGKEGERKSDSLMDRVSG